MAKKTQKKLVKENVMKVHHHSGNAVYGLGVIGSAIYYISTAHGFWNGVLGVLKAIVWPVFVTYGLLKFLGM